MNRKKLFTAVSLLMVLSVLLSACAQQQAPSTVVVRETVVVEATPVPATPEPAGPKVMVVCMAQEPETLYTLSEAALVKTAVLEAVYDWGVDTRSYDYQAVGIVELPSLDNGLASTEEVTVNEGDLVYDVVTDEVVPLASGVTLAQLEGDPVVYEGGGSAATVQQTVSWTLVDGITWEDGEPVTTEDILFAWEVASSPDSPNVKYTIERTTSYTASDDKTWTWVSLPGYTTGTYFVDALYNPLPKHVYGEGGSNPLSPAEMLEDESVNRDPLAFGPFRVDEWIAGDSITLSKNDTYYRASEGLPLLDTLIYRFIPDTNALIAQLASGECDMGTQDAAFEGSLPLIRQFESQGIMVPQVVAGTVYEHIDFNILPVETYTGAAATLQDNEGGRLFANADFRRAIAHCIDRQALADQVAPGAVVQHVYSPADHPLYAGDENITVYEFDPAKGLELLSGLGWTDSDGDGILDNGAGTPLAFIHSTRTNPLREKVTQVVQAQLKENCQIETTISLQGGEFFADGPDGPVFGRQYDFGEFAWLTGVEPPCSLYQTSQIPNEVNGWGAQNNTGWSNAEFDAACALATTTLDEAVKAEQHALAQTLFTEELPSLVLFARAKILVTLPSVTGVIMDPTANSELWNVENFDITQ